MNRQIDETKKYHTRGDPDPEREVPLVLPYLWILA